MKGRIVTDWNKVDLSTRTGQRLMVGAFQHFMTAPDRVPELKQAFQFFATKGDFPDEIKQILEKYHATPTWDMGYEQIFDIRDFTNTKESGFEILDVSSGLAFKVVGVGMKAEVYKMSGEKTLVSFDRYGGGLHWDRTWFEDGKYWMAEDNAIEFRNKAMASRAQSYYDLIEAVPSTHDVTWQNPAPAGLANTDANYQMNRDAQTLAKACQDILLRVKDKGYGVTPGSEFIVLAPIQLRTRINQAIKWMAQSQNTATAAVEYNVKPIISLMLTTTNTYYVILPKNKIKGGIRQDLTLLSDFDILQYADLVAGWQRYGGAIGDIEQISRCAIS